FDKGTQILKSVDFKKDKKEWLYQLKNAPELADRADAVVALGKIKNDDEAAAALGEALRADKTDGVRITAAKALGELSNSAASKQLLDSLSSVTKPWVRNHIVEALGSFKDDAAIKTRLETIAREDSSYRSRAAALQAIGRMKTPNAYDTLTAAVIADSPDGFLRDAALRAFGSLGDDKAVRLLRDWAAPGKNMESRQAAISSLARLQKDNKEITNQIAGYLLEAHFPIRISAIFALGSRGDASAIPALEALLKSNDLSIEMAPMIKGQIERLKNPKAKGRVPSPFEEEEADAEGEEASAKPTEDQRLSHLEQLVQEMNERLKSMESRLPPPPPNK
ncbi:MAG: HEAT repeat domain-containing protein, partial [Candidatus Acidiferrum sp.]